YPHHPLRFSSSLAPWFQTAAINEFHRCTKCNSRFCFNTLIESALQKPFPVARMDGCFPCFCGYMSSMAILTSMIRILDQIDDETS
ncbi:hypothetical protein BLOT_012769, partial [Blomia tropicalis]